MKILCILPSVYSEKSNGIVILCSIYLTLKQQAPQETICICNHKDESSHSQYRALYGDGLRTYSDQTKDDAKRILSEEPFVLVRPDNLEGIDNDIHWDLSRSENLHLTINILLAPPFAFASKVSILSYYNDKDFFLLGNQQIMPAFAGMEDRCLFIETRLDPGIWNFINREKGGARSRISVYIGKGIMRALPKAINLKTLVSAKKKAYSRELVLIKRSWPASREQLYSILASSRMLISYDPFSHIERVATCLGTPVVKPLRYNLWEIPGVLTTSKFSPINPESLPSPEEVQLKSIKDYTESIQTSKSNQSKIVLTILKAANLLSCGEDLEKFFIPYSRRCLFAFASQLRGLLPYTGGVSMESYNERINESEILELSDPTADIESLTPGAYSYRKMINSLSDTIALREQTNVGQVYYQYKRRDSPDWHDQETSLH